MIAERHPARRNSFDRTARRYFLFARTSARPLPSPSPPAARTPHVVSLSPLLPPAPSDDVEVRWFNEEVQPLEGMLRGWLHARFPARPDVDDLVQESYARLFRAQRLGRVKNVRNYLFATARNVALDLFRRESTLEFEPVDDNTVLSMLQGGANVAGEVSRSEELQILREAMDALPTCCRRVFTLRKVYGLSHAAIAGQLGISERTVEAQINKAMRRCANFLRARGLP